MSYPLSQSSFLGIPILDRAKAGVFTYSSKLFLPEFESSAEEGKESSSLYVYLQDVKNPSQSLRAEITRELQERIWADFEPYRDMLEGRSVELKLDRRP